MQFPTTEIVETAENAKLYNPFTLSNEDDAKLVADIREHGILTPLHVSQDGYLLDGHRRLNAALEIGLPTVPCIVAPLVFSELEPVERMRVLRSFNHQRDKTFDERVAEAIVDVNEDEAYGDVLSYRAGRGRVSACTNVVMGVKKARAEITTLAFLDAVVKIVNDCRDEWPISNRAVHYMLLNDPPLTHDSKPDSHYRNEVKPINYPHKLSSLLTRARIAGLIPMEAICDEERPVTIWDVCPEAGSFVAEQRDQFLRGYARDLMQSQPHHIEVVVEKRTKYAAAKNVAMNYAIPVTAGKGFASVAPRFQMAQRYRTSGKDKLIVIFLTDFDPDGEQIAVSFARSMRDDFGIGKIVPIKAALTAEQVKKYDLPSSLEAKPKSPNYKRFVEQYGTRAVELDAMPGNLLAQVLKDAIESVLDVSAFNAEVEQEKKECANIRAIRNAAFDAMNGGSP